MLGIARTRAAYVDGSFLSESCVMIGGNDERAFELCRRLLSRGGGITFRVLSEASLFDADGLSDGGIDSQERMSSGPFRLPRILRDTVDL
jgi:hypothetical protein